LNGFKKGIAVEELCQKCSYKERFNKGNLWSNATSEMKMRLH
jgi:hypothetical protein